MDSNCKFSIGDIIHHLRFDYRGVIYDVDATFQGTEEWYNQMAKSKPPRDQPWYHVLVDQSATMTYVAERNLEADSSSIPIEHPLVDQYFSQFKNGKYILQLSWRSQLGRFLVELKRFKERKLECQNFTLAKINHVTESKKTRIKDLRNFV